jgi:outer membrane protein OmpA-like peptidoglycan-associated protein
VETTTAPAPALAQPSAPAPTPAPTVEPSEISPETEGFWPAPESRAREISISVLIGNEKFLNSWRVELAPASGAVAGAVKTFAGSASDLPGSLTWNGIGPGGKLAREGIYTANLSADFTDGLPVLSLKSKPFALSLSPPEPVLYATPSRLERSADGIKKPVTFELAARAALARLDSWRLDVVGPDGRLFSFLEGAWPSAGTPAPISWDGRSGSLSDSGARVGAVVEAGKRYAAILSVRDVYGHAASTQAGIAVADLPFPPERSSVQPWTNGFSPNGDGVMDSMDFSLGFGQRSAIRSWRLDIVDAEKAIVRDFHGLAPDLPETISWDGNDSSGTLAPEGRYTATLHIDYGSTFSPAVARSSSFILDVTPPALRLAPSPALFSPASPISIRLDASSLLARVADWSIEILDPGNHVFARFGGQWPAAAISWDGMGADGSLVEPAETYRIVARARDEFGNSSQAEADVETDIFVTKEGEGYRVNVASILFKGYTDDYEDLPADQVAQNKLTLDRLAAEFSKFPDYRIRLIGHAVMINWDDPNLGKPEQEKILIPLSKTRAAAIAKALASRGIDASRMIVEGVGSTKPVVPDSDLINRWKNRRVEFYLEK